MLVATALALALCAGAPQAQVTPPPQAFPGPAPRAYGPAPYAGPSARPLRKRSGYGLFLTGAITWGVSYVVSTFVGAQVIDEGDDLDRAGDPDARRVRRAGELMFVPLVGPFLGLGSGAGAATSMYMLGASQVAGATMFTIGLVKMRRGRPSPLAWQVGDRTTASVQPWGRGASLRLVF